MVTAIIYNSLTGHTKQYAELLSAATGLPAYALGEDATAEGQDVIYLSWISAGRITDFAQARRRFRVRCVCASGMSPSTQTLVDKLRRTNGVSESVPLYYLQGGLDLEALPKQFRGVMKLICAHTEKKLAGQQTLTPSEEETLKMARGASSAVSRANLEPVLRWYRAQASL